MEQGAAVELTVHRITRLVRQRRALFYGLRGMTWGLAAALVPAALRAVLGPWTLPAAAGTAVLGAVGGAVYGLLLRVPPADAAWLADRAFALQDRVATALELLGRRVEGPMAAAAIRDAARHLQSLDLRRAVRVRWPRECRWAPLPVAALFLIAYLPPVPVPADVFPPLRGEPEEAAESPTAARPQSAERPAAKKIEPMERVQWEEREYAQRQGPPSEQARGDLAAVFKDTRVAQKRPDFSSFLKQGDERLRLLERADALPDLQRDFTQSPYKVIFRKSRALLAGVDPRQLSADKLRQLLEEMNRLGRRGSSGAGSGMEGEFAQDVYEGAEALERGQMSRALDAMERALQKLRAMEERERGGRRLEGGRERGDRDGRAGGLTGDEPDMGEGMGSLPGKGRNPAWRGDPTARLDQDPVDLGVEGQIRKGRKEAYDTNMIGRGAQTRSRLPNLSVFSQYRKMMEDALAKENIPFDYRAQVKEYFEALEER